MSDNIPVCWGPFKSLIGYPRTWPAARKAFTKGVVQLKSLTETGPLWLWYTAVKNIWALLMVSCYVTLSNLQESTVSNYKVEIWPVRLVTDYIEEWGKEASQSMVKVWQWITKIQDSGKWVQGPKQTNGKCWSQKYQLIQDEEGAPVLASNKRSTCSKDEHVKLHLCWKRWKGLSRTSVYKKQIWRKTIHPENNYT